MDKVRACKRLLSILLACVLAPMVLPTTAFAAEEGTILSLEENSVVSDLSATSAATSLGGTVEYVEDTETWYPDATKAFDTRNTYWNDQVGAAPVGYTVEDSSKTVSIGSPEALVWWGKQVNAGTSFGGYTVSITADLDLSAHYWTPICTGTVSYSDDGKYSIANNTTLEGVTINGNGHTITGLATQTGVRGPNQDSEPGDGQNCYYDAAFIGYSSCNVTIENLVFDGARIAISEPFDEVVNDYGSSMVAVIVGAQQGGSLTLNDVVVNDADVLAMQKASAFVGNLMGNSTLTVNQCAITNSRFSAYFQVAPIAAYGTTTQASINGIKLENNTIRMVDQTWPDGYLQNPDSGAWYINEGEGYVLNASATAVFYDGSNTVNGTSVNGSEWTPVAEANGYQYDTLAAAIAAVPDGVETTVTLTADCQLDDTVAIPEGKIVVLDLNGMAVTVPAPGSDGKSLYALDNKGTLTVTDGSSAQKGSITARGNYNYGTMHLEAGTLNACDSNGGGAAVWNEGRFEMTGGTLAFIGEKEGNSAGTPINNQAAASAAITGGALVSPYTCIFSYGNLEVSNISLSAETGFWDAIKVYGGSKAVLRNVVINASLGGGVEAAGGIVDIYDCTFTQKDYYDWNSMNVAASNGGIVNIHSGSFTSENYGLYIFSSGGTINVSGGRFDAKTVLKADNSEGQPSVINVSGGAFTGALGIANEAKLSITDGYFSSDPAAYVAPDQGLAAIKGSYVQDGVTYAYRVTTAPLDDVEVKIGATEVVVPSEGELGITTDQKIALDDAVSGITGSGLSDAGNLVAAEEEKLPTASEALVSFNEKLPAGADQAENSSEITVVVVPRLDVTVEAYQPDQNRLELEIKAVYDLKATTDSANMKEEGDVDNDEVNTVTLQKNAGTLDTIGTQVQVTVPLPAGFVSSVDESIFVIHEKDNGSKYIYKSTISGNADDGFSATFLNANGFSSFTLTKDIAASITDRGTTTYYETLQEAVNAVANGQTIKLEKNSAESVVVGEAISFTLDKNGNSFTGGIVAASGYAMSEENGVYTFTSIGGAGVGGGGAPAAEEYEVTVAPSEHGKVAAEPAKAAEDDTVTLTVTPDEGYELTYLSVLDADKAEVELAQNADGTYSFEMPASEVAVYAVFSCDGGELCPSHGFADVDQSQWYHEAIDWAVANKVLNGFDDTGLMVPDGEVTRAQMAQILWNVEGRPVVDYAVGFGDVTEGDWFYQAVAWAASEGIFKGYDDGSGLFGPGDVLTREQAAAVLMRWTEANGGDVDARADLSAYPDVDGISAWAVESGCVSWAVATGVISGVEQEDGSLLLDPVGTATRAQTAMLMMRLTAE